MRLLLFSDLHCDLDAARVLVERARDEAIDVAVGAGDFASQHDGLLPVLEALSDMQCPAVLVPGNNETEDALRAGVDAVWPGAVVLHGSDITIDGRRFVGLGGGIPPTNMSWSFDLAEADARAALQDLTSADILVLHSPPHQVCDEAEGRHLGSPALHRVIVIAQPVLAVCGHVHAAWEQEGAIGGTHVVNAGPRGVIVEV